MKRKKKRKENRVIYKNKLENLPPLKADSKKMKKKIKKKVIKMKKILNKKKIQKIKLQKE